MNRTVRTKLPVIPDESVSDANPEVAINDEKSKAKMKKYADEARKVKRHCLEKGDVVLVAQNKKNKFSTVYEPNLYEIEEVTPSMNTPRRSIDGRRITRNNSYYKRVHEARNDVLDQDRWNFEPRECNDVSNVKRCDVLPVVETAPELLRSRRTTQKPAWTRDYVVAYIINICV